MNLADIRKDFEGRIGQTTHTSEWLQITQERVDQFATATNDHNWVHVDPERASRESPFGGPIAHGYLTLSLIPYLRGVVDADNPVVANARALLNYGLNKVRFPSPVSIGARIRGCFELQAVEEARGNALQITERCTIEIEGMPKPACVAEVIMRGYF